MSVWLPPIMLWKLFCRHGTNASYRPVEDFHDSSVTFVIDAGTPRVSHQSPCLKTTSNGHPARCLESVRMGQIHLYSSLTNSVSLGLPTTIQWRKSEQWGGGCRRWWCKVNIDTVVFEHTHRSFLILHRSSASPAYLNELYMHVIPLILPQAFHDREYAFHRSVDQRHGRQIQQIWGGSGRRYSWQSLYRF